MNLALENTLDSAGNLNHIQGNRQFLKLLPLTLNSQLHKYTVLYFASGQRETVKNYHWCPRSHCHVQVITDYAGTKFQKINRETTHRI